MTTAKTEQSLRYGITGYILLIVTLAGITAFVLYLHQKNLVAKEISLILLWSVWGIFFSVLLLVVLLSPYLQRWRIKKRQNRYRPEPILTCNADPTAVSPYQTHFTELKNHCRQTHGRFWRQRIRILLVTGVTSDVEHLLPGLSSQQWQENNGTLLVWGGELLAEAHNGWMGLLRHLRYRPVDGVVWVTSAFDVPDLSQATAPVSRLSDGEMDSIAHALGSRCEQLGWRLPLYVWSLHPTVGAQPGRITQPVGCLFATGCTPTQLRSQLATLMPGLITRGVQQVSANQQHHFLLRLAAQLARAPESITTPLVQLLNPRHLLVLAGVIFSPPSFGTQRDVKHHWGMDNRWDLLPRFTRSLPVKLRPRKLGPDWRGMLLAMTTLLMGLWGVSMVVSFISNQTLISQVQKHIEHASQQTASVETRLRALSELQQHLARLQHRAEQGPPWYSQAGLNQNNALLTVLWPRYGNSALPLLRDAAAALLHQQLTTFVQLPAQSTLRDMQASTAQDQLALYLMLARPDKMRADWFSETLMQHWSQRENVAQGVWQENGEGLLAFYGQQLSLHPQWRIQPDAALVAQVRTLLVRQQGQRNNESALYQRVLAQVAQHYADMRLEDMTGDTRVSRLFISPEVVPGMFTRQAWEQDVQLAIDKVVSERREQVDWVLGDLPLDQPSFSAETLKQRLTARYFADFGAAWLNFLNSLHWQSAATLAEVIDQLTLLADVRQSPLVALMNTLNVQGRTGQSGSRLSDTLVNSAKNLLNRDVPTALDQQVGLSGPLDATFSPLLSLIDNRAGGVNSTTLNLQTYLIRVTQLRLRLQQVTNATDPQAMTQALAQTVFQGRAIDLTETRDYGSLIAAGLGQDWNGFGQTIFVRPMEQAWQQVLTPAAQSLNAQWRSAIVDEWNRVLGGRYPFNQVGSDASLPLLAKYIHADTGRISQFLQSRLNGVLQREGSRWIPDSINAQGLTFNPAFLQAMDTLGHISDVVFTDGEARLRFELRPGTAAGVMQTEMVIDAQRLIYVNQQPSWRRFTWPADTDGSGATLSWISEQTGTRQYADLPGAWGWIRLLDKASVSAWPGVNSSYRLTWQAPDGRALNYTLRTEAGEGPLALLMLRDFRLPETLFSVSPPHEQQEME